MPAPEQQQQLTATAFAALATADGTENGGSLEDLEAGLDASVARKTADPLHNSREIVLEDPKNSHNLRRIFSENNAYHSMMAISNHNHRENNVINETEHSQRSQSVYSNREDVRLNPAESQSSLPRLVLRNRPFGQSTNKVHIQHNQGPRIYSLLKHNWFHVFLRWPTKQSILFLMTIWTGAILLFAILYVWYDHAETTPQCTLGQNDESMTFAAAFAFSLETCTTVGYGLPHGVNSFFEAECGSLQFLIYLQMAWSMIFNAFLLAFLYARLGRSETRSNQVINSRKALVSCVDGQMRFQVRLFDVDAKHPVVEAHVRMYCVMNHRPVPRPLRLLQPDDEMGGMLFLSFPTVVSHHIDLYSLLHPPVTPDIGMVLPSGLVLRQTDGSTSSRDDVICPICGESYGTLDRWKNHVRYQQIVEAKDDYPVQGTHLSLDMKQIQDATKATDDLDELQEYFRKNVSEVICVVEGIDPLQSGTFQSLQSYRYEDIVWDRHSAWAPCLTIVNNNQQKKTGQRMFSVDLDRYHDIVLDTAAVQEEKKRLEDEAKAAILAAELEQRPSDTSTTAGADPMAGLTAALASVTSGDQSEEASTGTGKPRHRRVKSSSRRPWDGLFEEGEPANSASSQAAAAARATSPRPSNSSTTAPAEDVSVKTDHVTDLTGTNKRLPPLLKPAQSLPV